MLTTSKDRHLQVVWQEGCLVDVLCDNVRVIRRLLVKLKAVLDIVGKSDSGDLRQLSLTPLLSWRRTPSATLTFFLEMPTESVSL